MEKWGEGERAGRMKVLGRGVRFWREIVVLFS